MNRIFIFLIICSFSIILSCKEEKLVPNVDNIKVDVKWASFEKELFALDTNNIAQGITSLQKKYPVFYDIYFNNVLLLTNDSTKFLPLLKGFLSDKQVRKLYDTTEMIINKIDPIKNEMREAMKYFKFYFPKFKEPNIYTYISEYGTQRFIFQDEKGRNGIGLGLDLFLGQTYPYKMYNDPTNPNFSDYLARTFNKDHIVPKSVDLIIDDMVGYPKGNKMLDIMVNNGKKLYLKKLILPLHADTLIFEYTPDQMNWVEDNELEIWSFFGEQNYIYESIPNKIAKYVNPSPNAPGMPAEAPGNTANYIGMKIIEAYMKKFPQTSLEQLLQLKDAQKIMELSKYKPKLK